LVLITTTLIEKARHNNECRNFIVYGPLGYGKTAFSLNVLMELYDTTDPDILSRYFFFDPAEFLNKVTRFKQQVKSVAWDDAGVWLYYMDFQTDLIKNVSKLMQLIRTRTASVIYTTPTPTLILGKLRNFPQTTTLKISKRGGEPRPGYRNTARRVTAYQSYMLPDLHKLRVRKLYVDDFDVMLPRDVYKWYCNERRGYIEQIEEKLQVELPEALLEQIEADKKKGI